MNNCNKIKKIIKEANNCRPHYIEGPRGPRGPEGPTGPSFIRFTNGRLNNITDSFHIDVENVRFEISSINTTESQLSVTPVNPGSTIIIDLKRFSQYDISGVDSLNGMLDNYPLTSRTIIDDLIYSSSREMNRIWIRQQNPLTGLWSLHEVSLFVSNNKERVTFWVNEIFKDISL